MPKVAIVGTGFVGRAWAVSFARAGHEVSVWDADNQAGEAAMVYIGGIVPDLAAFDLIGGESPSALKARIRQVDTIEEALEGAIHVQENTPERLEGKVEIFETLDRKAPSDAVLASSTSAILPSAFTEGLEGRHRCLVVHPLNPPYLIPAAEVVPAPWTGADVVDRTARFLREAGHAPIVMKRELDGFIMNRLQGAVLEEAFRLVEGGYASAEDVDAGVRDGLALRWSFMGPFETIDLNAPGGIRDYVERYQHIYEALHPSMQARTDWSGPVLDRIEAERRQALPAADLSRRAVWRDRNLMALAAHRRRHRRDFGG